MAKKKTKIVVVKSAVMSLEDELKYEFEEDSFNGA